MNKLIKLIFRIHYGITKNTVAKPKDNLSLSRISNRIFREINQCRSEREMLEVKARIDSELMVHDGNLSLPTLINAIDRQIHLHKCYLETRSAINATKRHPLYKSIKKTG